MKKRLLSWWADIRAGDLNPIMVRELRQYTRSRFTSYVLVLMLAGLLLISAGFFTSSQGRVSVSGVELSAGAGAQMYMAVAGALGLASMLLALYTTQRMGNERQKGKPDLLFSTSLAPGAIVRGKLFAGLAMFGLFFSLALPFMTMTYLLRGIDVRAILWGLLLLLVLNVLLLSGAILLGCMPLGPLFRRGGIGLFAMSFWFLFMGVGPLRGFTRMLGPGGIGVPVFSRTITVVVVSVLVTIVLVPYAISVLILSPKWSNRARPFRITMTVLLALWAGLILIGRRAHGALPLEALMTCLLPATLALLMMLQIGECGADTPSTRVLKTVPRSWLGRILCFPFYAGGTNGLVWVLALLGGLYGAAFYAMAPGNRLRLGGGALLVTVIYALCYVLTASLISRCLPKSVREGAGAPWLVSLYFFAMAGMIPLFIEMLYETKKIKWHPKVELGGVFAMFHGQARLWRTHLGLAVPWLVLVVGLNLPRILFSFSQFRRPEETAEPVGEKVQEGAEATQP